MIRGNIKFVSIGAFSKWILLIDITDFIIVEYYYRIHFWFMTKSKAVDRIKNVDLSGQLRL